MSRKPNRREMIEGASIAAFFALLLVAAVAFHQSETCVRRYSITGLVGPSAVFADEDELAGGLRSELSLDGACWAWASEVYVHASRWQHRKVAAWLDGGRTERW